MTSAYLIPASEVEAELEIKKSRFICTLFQANNEQDAKQGIQRVRDKYADAGHHCWAYQLAEPKSTRIIGCSDDGEPHGTAGKPMLNVLLHQELGEVVAVVTRYYGGIKLGTGGLARAYADAVLEAMAKLPTTKRIDYAYAELLFDYPLQQAIEQCLAEFDCEMLESNFTDKVYLKCRFDLAQQKAISFKLNQLSRGQVALKILS
jgi:uncharacterized YigZ family protein